MNSYKISVIIPSYNNEKYIEEAINSALSQTYFVEEIIIVDDYSNDNTHKIFKKYQNKNRVKIIYNNNHTSNVGRMRNEAIKLSNGKIIAFLDADDIWEKDKLEKQIKYFENYDLICSNASLINDSGNRIKDRYLEHYGGNFEISFEEELKDNIIFTSSVLLKRKLLNESVKFEDNFGYQGEDYYLWLKLLSLGIKVLFVSESLVKYRLHDSSLIHLNKFEKASILNRVIKYKKMYINCPINSKRINRSINFGIANSYLNIGQIYYNYKCYKDSVEYFLNAFRYFSVTEYKHKIMSMLMLFKSVVKSFQS